MPSIPLGYPDFLHNANSEFAMTRRVAVIGAGTIGASWAAIFLARGFEVAATDPAAGAEDLPATSSTMPGRHCKNSGWSRPAQAPNV